METPVNERMAKVKKGIDAVRRFMDPPLEPNAPPMEIRSAVIEAIEREVAVSGIGKRLFPYGAVSIDVLLTRPENRTPFEVVFDDLEARLRQRFRERRVEVSAGFAARTTLLDEAPAAWAAGQRFGIVYAKAHPVPRALPPRVPALHVTILNGTASRETYRFQSAVVLVGRTAAAVDTRGRVRRNHVAFDQRSPTVSRAHARIVYDRERAEYRLLDEGSARGTRLVRREETLDVRPQHEDSRGVRLESGDEIHVGDAALRITIG
jgi:hypothetical protein